MYRKTFVIIILTLIVIAAKKRLIVRMVWRFNKLCEHESAVYGIMLTCVMKYQINFLVFLVDCKG